MQPKRMSWIKISQEVQLNICRKVFILFCCSDLESDFLLRPDSYKKRKPWSLLHTFLILLSVIRRWYSCDIMICVFSSVQTHALGGSKHGLCIDDWSPNQIRGREGGQGRHCALNLSASQFLSSLLTAGSLEGCTAKASYCNEEKCINLAWRVRRLSARRVKVHRVNPFS